MKAIKEHAEKADIEVLKKDFLAITSSDDSLRNRWDIKNAQKQDEQIGEILTAHEGALFHQMAEPKYETFGNGLEGIIRLENGLTLHFTSKMKDSESLPNRHSIHVLHDDDEDGEFLEEIKLELSETEKNRKTLKDYAARFVNGNDYNRSDDDHPDMIEIIENDGKLYHELERAGHRVSMEGSGYTYVDLGNGAWLKFDFLGDKRVFILNDADASEDIDFRDAYADAENARLDAEYKKEIERSRNETGRVLSGKEAPKESSISRAMRMKEEEESESEE